MSYMAEDTVAYHDMNDDMKVSKQAREISGAQNHRGSGALGFPGAVECRSGGPRRLKALRDVAGTCAGGLKAT